LVVRDDTAEPIVPNLDHDFADRLPSPNGFQWQAKTAPDQWVANEWYARAQRAVPWAGDREAISLAEPDVSPEDAWTDPYFALDVPDAFSEFIRTRLRRFREAEYLPLSVGGRTWPASLNRGEKLQQFRIGFETLFSSSSDYQFAAGHEGRISRTVRAAERIGGVIALVGLRAAIVGSHPATDCLLEISSYLGNSENYETLEARITILADLILHPSPTVRDGAAVGLTLTENRQAIPVLERAVEEESHPDLRLDMDALLEDLREATTA